MIKKTIAIQIWLVFTCSLALLVLLAVLVIPFTLKNFYKDTAFEDIEKAQEMILKYKTIDELTNAQQQLESYDGIRHIFLDEKGRVFPSIIASVKLLKELQSQAYAQKEELKRYTRNTTDSQMLYVIRRMNYGKFNFYIVSYVGETYQSSRKNILFKRLTRIFIGILFLSLLPSLLVAKHIVRPLVELEKNVKRIAKRDWDKPIPIDRTDELGHLTQSIEIMRQRLVQQDKAHQSYLQNISHELKTPVMVIRTYAQAIKDGIFPKGNLSNTVKVIEEEAERLEKKIYNILYLSKLDYLATHDLNHEPVDLVKLLEELKDRLSYRRSELKWSLELEPIKVKGNREQLIVALENIINNQIRYAKENIMITLSLIQTDDHSSNVLLRIWNDGPPIEPEIIDNLFEKFFMGEKGEFGLGLAIVQRIAALHKANVWAVNENNGVAFYLQFHLDK